MARIRDALESLTWGTGVTLWQDERDIQAGDDWQAKLWSGLRGSDVVVACLSEGYLASKWCRIECDEALKGQAQLIPCVLEPCACEGLPVATVQFANQGRPLSALGSDANGRSTWRTELVREVRARLGQDAPQKISPADWRDAFQLAGVPLKGEPEAYYAELLETAPEEARRVYQELAGLSADAPDSRGLTPAAVPVYAPAIAGSLPARATPAAPPVSRAPAPKTRLPEPPAAPIDGWTRYWRTRIDRTRPWRQLLADVRSQAVGDEDKAYLVVGEPRQEPVLFVRRIEGELLRQASEPAPVIVTLPFPPREYAAGNAQDVQHHVAHTLMERAPIAGLTPNLEPATVVQRAAQQRPLLLLIGDPLRPLASRPKEALVAFLGSLRPFVGASRGRWPIRVWLSIEEPRGATLHRELFAAMQRSGVAAQRFTLTFPPWDEVLEQLHEDPLFQGLTPADLARAEAAYDVAMQDAHDLTELANQLMRALRSAKERP